MNRLWTGVVAGVLAAALLLTVGIGAYRAGQEDEVVTQVVTDSETSGEVVRVVDDGWRDGPGPGFFLFPLLIIGLIFLFARRGRWHGHGHGCGPHGYRSYRAEEREAWMQDWHRRAHDTGADVGVEAGSPPPTTPSGTA